MYSARLFMNSRGIMRLWLILPVLWILSDPQGALAAAGDDRWEGAFGIPGADGPIYGLAVAAGGAVYVGGAFCQAGSRLSTNIAEWGWHELVLACGWGRWG